LWVMTKKKSSEILADENLNFSRKLEIGKILDGVREIFLKQGGESETRGEMHHCLWGWTSLLSTTVD